MRGVFFFHLRHDVCVRLLAMIESSLCIPGMTERHVDMRKTVLSLSQPQAIAVTKVQNIPVKIVWSCFSTLIWPC